MATDMQLITALVVDVEDGGVARGRSEFKSRRRRFFFAFEPFFECFFVLLLTYFTNVTWSNSKYNNILYLYNVYFNNIYFLVHVMQRNIVLRILS